ELLRASQAAAAAEEAARKAKTEDRGGKPRGLSQAAVQPAKRKRKFPYRKVADLEADIAAGEAKLQALEREMASPELYRDGERVKQVTGEFEQLKQDLQRLYEHWEEAVELNSN